LKAILQYLLYEFFHLWIRTGLRFFFRSTFYYNRKTLKQFKPTILIGNHENALIDALFLITASHRQPYSLTRSDIFKKPLVRKFLYTIRMLPVYRRHDGLENMKKNVEIFKKVTDELSNNRSVLIFPEGNQVMTHRLRPLKKGVFRFSFPAEEQTNWETGVHLVPIGIVYERHFEVHHDLVLNVGNPIYVRDYKEIYEKDSEAAIEAMKVDLAAGMSEVMLDIHSEEFYQEHLDLRKIFIPVLLKERNIENNFGNFFKLGQKFNKIVNPLLTGSDAATVELMREVKSYMDKLKELNIREETVRECPSFVGLIFRNLFLLLCLPIYGLSFLIHIGPLSYAESLSSKLIKAPKFILTLRFGIGLGIYTVYGLIFFILGTLISHAWMGGLGLTLLMFFSLPFYFEWKRAYKRSLAYARWRGLDQSKKETILNSRRSIVNRARKMAAI